MLDQLTVADFGPHLKTAFRTHVEPGDVLELELIEASPIGPADGSTASRQPFSLIFRGPRERLLGQRIYPIEHPQLGTLEIFLVPLGPLGDPDGLHYQAIFN
jgi:hypothetical protein